MASQQPRLCPPDKLDENAPSNMAQPKQDFTKGASRETTTNRAVHSNHTLPSALSRWPPIPFLPRRGPQPFSVARDLARHQPPACVGNAISSPISLHAGGWLGLGSRRARGICPPLTRRLGRAGRPRLALAWPGLAGHSLISSREARLGTGRRASLAYYRLRRSLRGGTNRPVLHAALAWPDLTWYATRPGCLFCVFFFGASDPSPLGQDRKISGDVVYGTSMWFRRIMVDRTAAGAASHRDCKSLSGKQSIGRDFGGRGPAPDLLVRSVAPRIITFLLPSSSSMPAAPIGPARAVHLSRSDPQASSAFREQPWLSPLSFPVPASSSFTRRQLALNSHGCRVEIRQTPATSLKYPATEPPSPP
ncbi:hypothetical protein HU200_014612 [Digitaria exilis]|uniref:Uncharacterized protein n=1 Tax=Digitaria exilis TaxID=1010633 RepID=A0A835FBP5_9POAL|nr:hypothetical protein HU200_014612 [Digitaria exilis]